MRSYSTTYTVDIHAARAQSTTLTASWTIVLQMVDPPGASDPILPDGSAAALDPLCNNDGLGSKAPYIDPNASRGNVSRFTWVHPGVGLDPGAPAEGHEKQFAQYNCNHQKDGPHGHQGLVTVVVSDDAWTCSASYKGTATGSGSDPDQQARPACTQRS
jgi:hypothetical protein